MNYININDIIRNRATTNEKTVSKVSISVHYSSEEEPVKISKHVYCHFLSLRLFFFPFQTRLSIYLPIDLYTH